eukprot:Lankesteria_metandrocarpae@DN2805_c0_g1_i1.p1
MNVFDAATTYPLGDASLDNMSGASPLVVQNMLDLPQRTMVCWEGVAWEAGNSSSPQQEWTGGSTSFVNCFMPTSPRYESCGAVSTPTVAEMNAVNGTSGPRPTAAEMYPGIAAGARVDSQGADDSVHFDTGEVCQLDTAASGYHSGASWYGAPSTDSDASKVCLLNYPIVNKQQSSPKLQGRGLSPHTLSPSAQPITPSASANGLYTPAMVEVACTAVGMDNRELLSKITQNTSTTAAAVSNRNGEIINERVTNNISTIASSCGDINVLQQHFSMHQQHVTTPHQNNITTAPRPRSTYHISSADVQGGATHPTIRSGNAHHELVTQGDSGQNLNNDKNNILRGSQTADILGPKSSSSSPVGVAVYDAITVAPHPDLCIRPLAYTGQLDRTAAINAAPGGSTEVNDGFCGAGGGSGVTTVVTPTAVHYRHTADSQELSDKRPYYSLTTDAARGAFTHTNDTCSGSYSSGDEESATGGNRQHSSADTSSTADTSIADRQDGIPICLVQDARLTVLVNPRQHSRILKRRLQRQTFRQCELAREVMRPYEIHGSTGAPQEKAYIHESRHLHAKRRPRGPGGRFLPTNK